MPAELPAADADEARREQILHNLVGNAVKFTVKGHVEISALPRGEQIEVVVEDTGIGIAESDRDRIFRAFEQADSGDRRAFGGTGLGLAVTRRLVRLHGGSIGVESTLGEGTRFTFTLPVSRQPARPAQAVERPVSRPLDVEPEVAAAVAETAPTPPDGRGLPGARLLVVDDEPTNWQGAMRPRAARTTWSPTSIISTPRPRHCNDVSRSSSSCRRPSTEALACHLTGCLACRGWICVFEFRRVTIMIRCVVSSRRSPLH